MLPLFYWKHLSDYIFYLHVAIASNLKQSSSISILNGMRKDEIVFDCLSSNNFGACHFSVWKKHIHSHFFVHDVVQHVVEWVASIDNRVLDFLRAIWSNSNERMTTLPWSRNTQILSCDTTGCCKNMLSILKIIVGEELECKNEMIVSEVLIATFEKIRD